jgi:hypothetical protein
MFRELELWHCTVFSKALPKLSMEKDFCFYLSQGYGTGSSKDPLPCQSFPGAKSLPAALSTRRDTRSKCTKGTFNNLGG